MRISWLMVLFGLAACSSKGASPQPRDASPETGAQPDSGTGGGAAGVGGAAGGRSGVGGAAESGGIYGTGGVSVSGGNGGKGGSSGTGGISSNGGAGGSRGVDASADKPKPTRGTPCRSQDDCGASSTQLYCRAPGEPYGCGTCQRAVSDCASDADCAPDGGSATVKKICELAATWQCYCSPTKLCLAGCRTSADCGTGQACNDSHSCEKTCVAGDGSCSVDFSCSASGFCRRSACTSDSQCSVACVKGACYDSRGVCELPAA